MCRSCVGNAGTNGQIYHVAGAGRRRVVRVLPDHRGRARRAAVGDGDLRHRTPARASGAARCSRASGVCNRQGTRGRACAAVDAIARRAAGARRAHVGGRLQAVTRHFLPRRRRAHSRRGGSSASSGTRARRIRHGASARARGGVARRHSMISSLPNPCSVASGTGANVHRPGQSRWRMLPTPRPPVTRTAGGSRRPAGRAAAGAGALTREGFDHRGQHLVARRGERQAGERRRRCSMLMRSPAR